MQPIDCVHLSAKVFLCTLTSISLYKSKMRKSSLAFNLTNIKNLKQNTLKD